MAGSVNKVILVGNLGADPEIRTTQNGKKIANMRLAVSDTWRDKASGERKEKTEWITVVIFSEGLSGVAERYLRKGSKVYIEGALATRKWTDKQGQDRYSTEVVLQGYNCALVMLDGPSGGARQPVSAGAVDDSYYPQPDDEQSWQSAPVGKAGGGYGAAKSGGGAWKEKKMDGDIPF